MDEESAMINIKILIVIICIILSIVVIHVVYKDYKERQCISDCIQAHSVGWGQAFGVLGGHYLLEVCEEKCSQ